MTAAEQTEADVAARQTTVDLNAKGMGHYEFVRIEKADTGKVTLKADDKLTNGYHVGAQSVSVPEYKDVTVTASGTITSQEFGSEGDVHIDKSLSMVYS